jgi:hypothetical protein
MKARTAQIKQIKDPLVSAPEGIRARYSGMVTSTMIPTMARTWPEGHLPSTTTESAPLVGATFVATVSVAAKAFLNTAPLQSCRPDQEECGDFHTEVKAAHCRSARRGRQEGKGIAPVRA